MKYVFLSWIAVSFVLVVLLNTPQPIRIEGDGVFYYSWLHSALFDRDIDIGNQLEHFASYDHFSRVFVDSDRQTPMGLTPNPYPYGTALIWAPAVLLVHFVLTIIPGLGVLATGYSDPYVWAIHLTSWACGIVAAYWVWQIARRVSDDRRAAWATVAMISATPWLYYQHIEPMMSHMPALAVTSLWWYLTVRLWRREKVSWWIYALVTFLMIATRWQNSLMLVAYLPLIWRERREIRKLLLAVVRIAIPVVAAWGAQMTLWHTLYGQWWLTPQGSRFVRPELHMLYTLFSTDRGLILWSPIVALALIGLYFLWRRDRYMAGAAIAVFVLQWLLNSSLNDLSGGDAFGGRRYIETLPFLAPALAALLIYCKDRSQICIKTVYVIIIILIVWNLTLIQFYRHGLIPRTGEFNPLTLIK